MPEAFIINRLNAEIGGFKAKWLKARKAMSAKERACAEDIVRKNVFDADSIKNQPPHVADFLSHYLIRREDIPAVSAKEKQAFIAKFEASCTKKISGMCRELLAKC